MTPDELIDLMGQQQIKLVDLEELFPWEENPRLNKQAAPKLAKTIERQGWTVPMLIQSSTMRIIAGHTRRLAAQILRLERVPCILLDVTDAEAREIALTDNRMGELSIWNAPRLADLLSKFDLPTVEDMGWDGSALEKLANKVANFGPLEPGRGRTEQIQPSWTPPGFGRANAPDPSAAAQQGEEAAERPAAPTVPEAREVDAPEPPKDPITKRGDVWRLGDHVLICGDCVSLPPPPECTFILSDPPYSSGARQSVGRASSTSIGNSRGSRIERDNLTERGYKQLMTEVYRDHIRRGLVFTDWRMWSVAVDTAEFCGMSLRGMVVWDKMSPGMGFPFMNQHELVAYLARDSFPSAAVKDGNVSRNVFNITRDKLKAHPTVKPVELLMAIMKPFMWEGPVIWEPFAGSGSTILAAEQLGLRSHAREIDPGYCDVAIERWQELTGGTAKRESGGKSKAAPKKNPTKKRKPAKSKQK